MASPPKKSWKVTPKARGEMRRLRAKGVPFRAIAKRFRVDLSTVQYHTNPRQRRLTRRRGNRAAKKHYYRMKKEGKCPQCGRPLP